VIREAAWRVFAAEFNDATLEVNGGGDRAPSYVITPLGAKVNRIYAVGVVTDVENIGTDMQPMWRARVQDPTGTFHLYAGQYQPAASAVLSKLKPPVFGAVVGKSRTYTPDSGTVYTSIRPEIVKTVDENARDYWILEACQSLKRRLDAMAEASRMDPPSKEALVKLGVRESLADGIVQAVGHYGMADLSRYTAMLAEALRYLLPEYRGDRSPETVVADIAPAAPEKEPEADAGRETSVLEVIVELDKDGKGAPWDAILTGAKAKGLSKEDLEEAINGLLDKGLVYEPVLGRMKKI